MELKKELVEKEKLLNDNLYKLKINYKNEIKLWKSNNKISKENIKKKYKRINDYYNKILNEELDNLENEFNCNISNFELNKKIAINENL